MQIRNRNVELLAPAGNMERLITAIHFGADAVYLGATDFSLRNFADNFTMSEIADAVKYAHERGVKVYVTINAFLRDCDLDPLPSVICQLRDYDVDALIVNDPGAIRIARRVAPGLPLHLSTQANTLNSEAAMFWHEQGVERIVLARELSLNQIKCMREKLPASLELEAFIHGAMCVSYSGRCLLSNYIDGHDSNRGECVQPCRWSYEVRERGKGGEYFTVVSERTGSFILNSRDMNMSAHLNDIIDAGIVSLKIEGRMKSVLYTATVVNAYRMALDGCDISIVSRELNRISHRPYTTGFAFESADELMAAESGGYIQDYRIAAVVLDYDAERKLAYVEQRNRFCDGDTLSILSPKDVERTFVVNGIQTGDSEYVDCAPHPQQKLYIGCSEPLKNGDILRSALEST